MVDTAAHPDGPTIRGTVDRYLAGLESADFEMVGNCFADDAFYSHPPFEAGGDRAEARGRTAILELLRTRRKSRGWTHEITGFFSGEGRCVIETRVREYAGGPVRSDSAGVGTFDTEGRITRWVAYRSDTMIGGTLTE